MENSDILFFTSVAEGTPHVVLEAIGNGLPIICFDVCGHGDSVNDKVGIKISVSNPEQSVEDFTNAISLLKKDRTLLKQISENCKQRQDELSWNNKALQMVKLYNKTLNKYNSCYPNKIHYK